MATTFSSSAISRGVLRSIWTTTATADSATPLSAASLADKTVQVTGTFDGATLVIQGSNDLASATGPTYHTLNDSRGEGNALSFTAADTRTILENTNLIRPQLTSATGSPDLTVVIVSQSTKR